MPSINPKVYTFASIYLGDASPATGLLQAVTNIRTDGVAISDTTPSEYIPWLNISCMTGLREVKVDVQFYDSSSTSIPELAAKGISLSGSIGDNSDFQQYSLLLISPDDESRDNFYFPAVTTLIKWEKAFKKDSAIVVPVSFFISSENNTDTPYYEDTVTNLITQMGSRSPI